MEDSASVTFDIDINVKYTAQQPNSAHNLIERMRILAGFSCCVIMQWCWQHNNLIHQNHMVCAKGDEQCGVEGVWVVFFLLLMRWKKICTGFNAGIGLILKFTINPRKKYLSRLPNTTSPTLNQFNVDDIHERFHLYHSNANNINPNFNIFWIVRQTRVHAYTQTDTQPYTRRAK